MATAAAVAFAGKSVATPAISFLIKKAFACLDKYCKAEHNMQAVKERLESNLVHVQAIFEAVDGEQVKEHSAPLNAWLWQIRDTVEEAEDSLDDVEYYRMEDEVRARSLHDELRDPISRFIKRKLVHRLAKYAPRSSTLKRLRNAVLKLDEVTAGVGRFLQLVDRSGVFDYSHRQRQQQYDFSGYGTSRETSSILSASEVLGRGEEKKRIVEWLVKPIDHEPEGSSSNNNNISVFTISGVGGMGKTTLAQAICREKRVLELFDLVIWACVSNTFEAASITSKIMESVTKAKPSATTLDALQRSVMMKLDRKRFLLVLDDVWEDKEMNEWEKLLAPFRSCQRGSKILLTTRMQSVADIAAHVIGGEGECMKLDGLEEDDTLLLFNKHAFAGLNPMDYTDLQIISRKIVKHFRGCPLVAKVVGAHLRGNLSYQYWSNILKKDLQGLQGSMDDVMKVLRLSYYHLPMHLQICFRYCSIFPQDYRFEKERLVKMWMGSGLIPRDTSGSQRPEDIGEEYLVHLTRKSFFDFTPTKDSDGILGGYYAMHDLMHDLARSVSSGECARIDGKGCNNFMKTVRHLCIGHLGTLSTRDIDEIAHMRNLRTLIIENYGGPHRDSKVLALEKAVESLKGLRLLIFNSQSAFSAQFANLKHLRYIVVPWLSRERICDVFKLYHLILFDTCNYLSESTQINCLSNLAHLRYVNFGIGFQFPTGRLTSLQVVHAFWVQSKEGYRISELKDLRSIRKIKLLGLENVKSPEEAAEAKLHEKKHLNSLLLEWSNPNLPHRGQWTNDLLVQVLDHLKPNANLQDLSIIGHCGARVPVWLTDLSLVNLVSLKLKWCVNWESLPALRELQLLKHLTLHWLLRLRRIGNLSEGYNNRRISASEERTDSDDRCMLPPRLDTFIIEGCPELKELPTLPHTLTKLKIKRAGLMRLPRMAVVHGSERIASPSELSNLLSAEITNCAHMTSLGRGLLHQEEHTQALEVTIEDCESLEHAQSGFARVVSLRTLTIGKCQNLSRTSEVGGMLLPMSLEKLSVSRCGELVLPLLSSLQGLRKLRKLELSHCSCVVSLPSEAVFRSLTALQEFRIRGCKKLSSLGGLGELPSVRELEIKNCTKLIEAALSQPSHVDVGCSLMVGKLIIDDHSLLLVEPLRSLCGTKNLLVQDGSGVEHVPEPWLQGNVGSLESIQIWGSVCMETMPPDVRSLPRERWGESLLQSIPVLPQAEWEQQVSGSDLLLKKL